MLEIDSSGVVKATGNLEVFQQASQKAENSANNLNGSTSNLDEAFGKLNLSALTAVAGVTALYQAFTSFVGGLTDFGSQAVQTYSDFELIQTGLENVLVNMGETEGAGVRMFETLRKFSLETTFGVDTLASVAQQLLTVGVASDEVQGKILQLGNIAGGSTQKFTELAEVYQKIQAEGKASSIRLQQLSRITGVSWTKELNAKSASVEEFEAVLSRLTAEGGKFYGAMDALNDTISGKQEFVSSTWTELLASFGELAGLADTYKSVLDGVYNVLQKVVDTMNSWNDNPLMQALMRGVMYTVIGGIIGLLGGGLVSALIAINTQLGITAVLGTAIKALFSSAGLISMGVVAGLAGLSAVIATVAKNSKELQLAEIEKKTQAYRDQIDVLSALTDAEIKNREAELKDKDNKEWSKDDIVFSKASAYYEQLKTLEETKSEMERFFREYNAMYGENLTFEEWLKTDDGILHNSETQFKTIERSIDGLREAYEKINDEVKVYNAYLKEQKSIQDTVATSVATYTDWMDKAKEAIASSNVGKRKALQEQISALQNYINNGTRDYAYKDSSGKIRTASIGLTSEDNAVLQQYLSLLQGQLASLTSSAGSSVTTWQEFWKSVTGVNVLGITARDGKSAGTLVGEKTIKELEEARNKAVAFKKLVEPDTSEIELQYDSLTEQIENYKDMIIKLGAEKDIDSPFTTEDASIRALVDDYYKLIEAQKKYRAEYDRVQMSKEYKSTLGDFANDERIQKKVLELKGAGKNDYASAMRSMYESELSTLYSQMASAVLAGDEELGKAIGMKIGNVENALKALPDEIASSLQGYINKLNENADNAWAEMRELRESGDTEGARQKGFEAIDNEMLSSLLSTIQGTGAGRLANDIMKSGGDVGVALLSHLGNELLNVIGNIDGLDEILSPLNTFLVELTPLFKAVLLPLALVTKQISSWGEKLMNWLDTITGGFFTEWSNYYDEIVSNTAEDDNSALIDALNKLKDAIEDEEEYYLAQKRSLNAKSAMSVTPVNDMILTSKGVFSTSPQDTIMAMKNPESLMSGGNISLNVNVENTMPDADVSVQKRKGADGMDELFIKISKKVASDYALGINGWDNANKAQQSRLSGRRVTV